MSYGPHGYSNYFCEKDQKNCGFFQQTRNIRENPRWNPPAWLQGSRACQPVKFTPDSNRANGAWPASDDCNALYMRGLSFFLDSDKNFSDIILGSPIHSAGPFLLVPPV